MNSGLFFQRLPAVVKLHLSPDLQKFRAAARSWLAQLYYADPLLHYEVWNLGETRGRLELGLHFESKDRAVNARYLSGFERYIFEIKTELGESWEAEPWDKGWTKVYTTLLRESFSEDYLEQVAAQLARAMTVLQPMFEEIRKRK